MDTKSKSNFHAETQGRRGCPALSAPPRLCALSSRVWLLTFVFLPACSSDDDSPTKATQAQSTRVTAEQDETPGVFTDMTAHSGVDFTYRNGQESNHFAILESLGGGIGLIDYDQDGLLDFIAAGGGHYGEGEQIFGYPNRLFRNEGGFKFKDVTEGVGLPTDRGPFYSHGFAVGDYDNDGLPDFLITGYARCALYRNVAGKFEDVTTQAGLPGKIQKDHWSTGAAWCDFNGDGWLDLYIEHYTDWAFGDKNPKCGGSGGQDRDVCSPKQFYGIPDQLFLNNGDGTFRDVSKEAGLRQDREGHDKGLGVLVADFNDDGRPDIYVANDTTDNFLYINQGPKDAIPQFKETGLAGGSARDGGGTPNGSMGVDAADYDGSGRMSIFVTNYQHEVHGLYRNMGVIGDVDFPLFHHASEVSGVRAIGLIYVGFGTGFFDYDLDGDEDIMISNGHVVFHPPPPGSLRQKPILFENLRKPGQQAHAIRFANVTEQGGPYFRSPHMGRGVAFGDLNNDGRTDLIINHTNEPIAILNNSLESENNWLGVKLVGNPNGDAVCAKVTLEVGDQTLVRMIKGGGSYLSAHDLRVIFGLGQNKSVGKLTVRWPSGAQQTWENLDPNRYWRLEQGVDGGS